MISISEAFQRIAETVRRQPTETAPLAELIGRYLCDPVAADIDSPPHDKSMMDGFAVRSADIQPGASLEVLETGPVRASLRIVTPWRNSRIIQTISLLV